MFSRLQRIVMPLAILSMVFSPVVATAQRLPAGSPCPVVTDQPYRSPTVSTVYYVTSACQKRPIFNPAVYLSHFSNWSDVIFLEQNEIDAIPNDPLNFLPWGPLRTFQNGSLVKTTDDSKVYLLEDQRAYPFTDEGAFKSFGYDFSQVEDVTADVLSKYTHDPVSLGGVDMAPVSVVFKYADDPKVYVLAKDGSTVVKEYIPTEATLSVLARPDRIAVFPPTRTFPDRPLPIIAPTPPAIVPVPTSTTPTPPAPTPTPTSTAPAPTADTTAPSISFLIPDANSTLIGTANIQVTATDNVGVTEVQFLIGTTVIGTDNTSPYAVSVNTLSYNNGSYVLTATAKDAAGNVTTVTRTVSISNQIETPVPPSSPPMSVAPGNYDFTISYGGLNRVYRVHIPTGYDSAKQYPVLFQFHGGTGTIASAESSTGFDALSDQKGFLMVYEQGTTGTLALSSWNAGNCCGQAQDRSKNVDDVGFTRQVVAAVKSRYSVNASRVYMAGISNGAMLVNRLACEATDLFSGAAAVAGTIQVATCTPSRPIPFLSVHGTADTQVPYYGGNGGTYSSNSTFMAEELATANWASRNGCGATSSTTRIPPVVDDGFTTVDQITFPGCSASTVLYRVNGGGHTWPGGTSEGSVENGSSVTSLNASQTITSFFGL